MIFLKNETKSATQMAAFTIKHSVTTQSGYAHLRLKCRGLTRAHEKSAFSKTIISIGADTLVCTGNTSCKAQQQP